MNNKRFASLLLSFLFTLHYVLYMWKKNAKSKDIYVHLSSWAEKGRTRVRRKLLFTHVFDFIIRNDVVCGSIE